MTQPTPSKAVKSGTGDATPEFWRGVRWAINQLEIEAHDLSDIRDGYIEARRTGQHSGRRIPEAMAKEFAGKFHERSDAVFMAADHIASLIAAPPSGEAPK